MATSPQHPDEIVRINPGSDGHDSQWPNAGLRREDATVYLVKLATKWMQDRGEAVPGRKYCLDRLPSGYALFGKTRHTNPDHVDRYLYGHPMFYKFRSSEEFYPHFLSLMNTGTADGCNCIGCSGGRKRPKPTPSTGTGASQRVQTSRITDQNPKTRFDSRNGSDRSAAGSRQPDDFSRQQTPEQDMVDDEGNPDVFRRLAGRLKESVVLEEPIVQSKSFDWIIDRRAITPLMRAIASQPAFVPRQGEIVLFLRDQQQSDWEAGVVTDIPKGPISSSDLNNKHPKTFQFSYSGFRIEPMSLPGSAEKHWSKRSTYVPINAIRPFNLYREVLKTAKPKNYHPTVQHALTAMSSISLFSPVHFKGLWPTATVFCRGIFIGSELIVVGDLVRLMPNVDQNLSQVWDVLKVTSIKFKMFHLDAYSSAEYDDPTSEAAGINKHHDCCIHVDGIAFTRDQSRAWKTEHVSAGVGATDAPTDFQGYGHWHPLHDPARRWKVPFSRILGRCYEHPALVTWLGDEDTKPVAPDFSAINQRGEKNDISKGLQGVMAARAFSTQRDIRLQSTPGKTWFWADHRVEQLDLHEVKGQIVAPHIHGLLVREPRAWKRAMSIREKGAGHRPNKTFNVSGTGQGPRRGRPPKAGGSMLAASAVGAAVDDGVGATTTVDEDEGMSDGDSGEMDDAQQVVAEGEEVDEEDDDEDEEEEDNDEGMDMQQGYSGQDDVGLGEDEDEDDGDGDEDDVQ